jgi:F-type H+-transporting ATPase subunit epsilon
MTPFPLQILTPAGPVFDGPALFVGARSTEGALGVLARHAPMVAACPAGAVRVQRAEGWAYFAVSPAILRTDGRGAVVLAARAEPADGEAAAIRAAREWEQPGDSPANSNA